MWQAHEMDTETPEPSFEQRQAVVASYETVPLNEWDQIIAQGSLAYDERAATDLLKDGLWLDLAHHYARSAIEAAKRLGDVMAQERLQALGEQIREQMEVAA